MADETEHERVVRELAYRVATLEGAVAFLEVWCEEQQDLLDRVADEPFAPADERAEPPRVGLHVVDLRNPPEPQETDHERKVRMLRDRIDNLRHLIAAQDELAATDPLWAGERF